MADLIKTAASEPAPELYSDSLGYEDSQALKVALPVFEGPLDLLLYLIRKNELDIYDIPIGTITHQYLDHLRRLETMNLDVAAEFIEMAATLIYIKGRMLLPQPEPAPESGLGALEDPRSELVAQLIAHERLVQIAKYFDELESVAMARHPRPADAEAALYDAAPVTLKVEMMDLLEAFRDLLARVQDRDVLRVTLELISVSQRIQQILGLLEREPEVSLARLVEGDFTRMDLITTLLALLEMAKQNLIRVVQYASFGGIHVMRNVETMEAGALPA
jgi:segregation and condensation protein A